MSVIHPSSVLEEGAIIGQNVNIGPFCYIASCVEIGDNCTLTSHVSIGHDPQSWEPVNPDGRVVIGSGTIIRECATIHRPCKAITKVGDNCLLMATTHVAHDCVIGNKVIITNCSGVSGYCEIGEGTVISGLCHIHQHSKIGRYCMIGSQSFFKGESPDGLVWYGNVATPRDMNVIGLDRHNPPDRHVIEQKAKECIRNHYETRLVRL